MTRAIALALVVPFLSGCFVAFDETTLVHLRRPVAAVAARTPTGYTELLDTSAQQAHTIIPPSRPPFTEQAGDAEVERDAAGVVTLDCPSCTGRRTATVLDADGAVALNGAPSKTLAWTHDSLTMRYGFESLLPCRRGHGLCSREALTLWLTTPAANVTAIRYRKLVATAHGERIGAVIGVVVGSLAGLFGPGLVAGTWMDQGKPVPVAIGAGALFTAIGAFFLFEGIFGLAARDSEVRVYP